MAYQPTALPWQVKFTTLMEMFQNTVQRCPDRLYLKSGTLQLTYAEAAVAIQAMSQWLGPEVRGRSVALVLPNSISFLIAYYATLSAGGFPALVNHGHPNATVAKLLEGLDVATTLSDREIPGLDVKLLDDEATLGMRPLESSFDPELAPDDVAAILFSGGTTGLPKQIAHTNGMLVAAVERMEWGWPTHDEETWLPVAPFTHVYGFLMGVLNPVLRGGTIVIPPRFQPDLIIDLLKDEGVTVFGGGPPAIYQALMASTKFERSAFETLRVCPGGGAPFPIAVLDRWRDATGISIHEGYGMTEIAPIAVNTDSHGVKSGAAGKAVPNTTIEIVDLATGQETLPAGESGEIRVKGPHMMTGYTDQPEETAIALRDGFVYTGDIGSLDEDGFLTISDRKKDVIFVKGFNVFPRELEETLLSHAAVSGACVVGTQDDRSGERPVAYVTLREEVATEDIAKHCAEILVQYKHPSEIIVLDAFPMTPAAKVDRAALRARANKGKP